MNHFSHLSFRPLAGILIVSILSCIAFQSSCQEQPNILFIVSEDNGPELGCYGTPVETPNLDKLASEGVMFKNAYVPQAGCSQSRASIWTGLYPHQNGQIGLATWKYQMYSEDTPNVVRSLKEAGYTTGNIGKIHVNPEDAFPFDFKAITKSNFNRKDMDQYASEAEKFMTASKKPFFLQVNFPDAHAPFLKQVDGLPERPLNGSEVEALPYMAVENEHLKEITANYYNCMMRMDAYIGNLLEALKRSGKADNTLVVYIGDHGADILRGKRTCYEGGLKIPMIIWWKGKVLENAKPEELVNTIDLYPTFLDVAGLDIPEYLPGKSLVPLFREEATDWRTYLFAEYHVHSNHNPYPQRTVRDQRYKLIWNPLAGTENPGYAFTLNHTVKISEEELYRIASSPVKEAYLRMKNPPEYELYDLKNDPYELINLAENEQYAKELKDLKKQLHAWQIRTSDALTDTAKARVLFERIREAGIEQPREKVPYFDLMKRAGPGQPNVLFITIDDMNDWTTVFDKSNPIKTPNIEKLAARGAFFTNAHCSSPACNPSRASVMTGTRPHKTGIYGNSSDWRGTLPKIKTIQRHFKDNGYLVCGSGKIFHHHKDWAFHDNASFHEYLMMSVNEPYPDEKLNGLDWYGSRNTDWGAWPEDITRTADYRTAEYAIHKLNQKYNQPFFLNVGIYKPHSPFFAPQEFFDEYPSKTVTMPEIPENDLTDLPEGAKKLMKPSDWFWEGMIKAQKQDPDAYKNYVQAYQGCASFADAMIGKIIDALDKSPYSENTIIVLWSDHGFHLGEKQHFEKFALWEKTTHIPFIVIAPGITSPGTIVNKPVDMTTIYPTLSELCGLDVPEHTDGFSLVPLLKDNAVNIPPALTTYMKGNHAIRTERWRYIQYADGSEELYDHKNDPHEWHNVAGDEKNNDVIEKLKKYVPKENAEQVPDL
jgi:arylsulfatase A-like enzyme